MSLPHETIRLVRERADFACEYCGVSEQNAGGKLSVDHFRPQSKGGGDELENLVYACTRCNLYKSNFWTEVSVDVRLWNPRRESAENHFWQADDGQLFALTEMGELSIQTLKLNRPQLIEYRQHQRLLIEERRLLEENDITIEVLFRLGEEQAEIIRTQQTLLDEQRQLLKILLEQY